MVADSSPLCCCEYFDVYEERNHILLCCCNCQDFDEGFDSFVSGRGVPRHNQAGFMATLHDRLRIPWKGGAKQISVEAAASIILVPTFLAVASLSREWTAISGCIMIIFFICIKSGMTNSFYRNRFFHAWTITSLVILYIIFQFVVIPFLEILWEENITLTGIILVSCFWFWKTTKRRVIDSLGRNCVHCMRQVPNDSRHCAWLNCCIGPQNSRQYLYGLTAAVAALLYGCNLTLTTVCHPFTWLASILLPDDCSDAYDLFELSLSFVAGIYSLGIAVYFSILLIEQAMLTTFGRICVGSSKNKNINDNFIA